MRGRIKHLNRIISLLRNGGVDEEESGVKKQVRVRNNKKRR